MLCPYQVIIAPLETNWYACKLAGHVDRKDVNESSQANSQAQLE